MNNTMSIYLDLVRISAAILVFLHHAADERFTGNNLGSIGSYGEDAVMVFFVLSGYVICHVSTERECTPEDYFASRLARLYSVAFPALLLTALFDYVGHLVDPTVYLGRSNDTHPWIRALISLSFTNQLWFLDIRYFSNTPYWSVSYEFWYYILWGAVLFLKGRQLLATLGILMLLVGPLILLLAPVWLLGIWVYRMNRRILIPEVSAWLLFVGSLFMYGWYSYLGLRMNITAMSDLLIAPFVDPNHLHKARFFLHDYIVGLLVASHFLGASALFKSESLSLERVEQPIRFGAAYTYSLYLFHYPILHLLAALVPWPASDLRRTLMLLVSSIVLVLLFGSLTEKKKHVWKKALMSCGKLISRRVCAQSNPRVNWRNSA